MLAGDSKPPSGAIVAKPFTGGRSWLAEALLLHRLMLGGLVVKVGFWEGRRLVGGEMGQPSPSERLALILDELEWQRI